MGSSSSTMANSAESSRRKSKHTSPTHRSGGNRRRADDAPPPYTESSVSNGSLSEDILETLTKFKTVIVVDDSSSMRGDRWEEAKNALARLVELAGGYSRDGIDVYFLNREEVGRNITNPSDLRKLFQGVIPKGATPIGNRLEELLTEYLSVIEHVCSDPVELKKIRPVNYLVITDGYPTDDPESVIVQAAKRLDERYLPTTQVCKL
ncbi:hypothetical protein AX15_007300 [Amanita polypyramis BW_CC]|nr:hypothetical protein AX15_007300 [Amanita polypyramis BW_CC]